MGKKKSRVKNYSAPTHTLLRREYLTFVGLGVLFIALLTLTVLQNTQMQNRQNAEDIETLLVFPNLTLENLQAVRLNDIREGREIILVKYPDNSWGLPNTESGQYDPTFAQNVPRTIILLPYQRIIENPSELEWTNYGLIPTPLFQIEFFTLEGESHVVAVGNRAPSNAVYYALVDEREDVYLIDRAPIDYLLAQIIRPPITPSP